MRAGRDGSYAKVASPSESLNGQTSVLVKDDTTGNYHPADDPSELVQYKTSGPNGAYNGEYWVVTTTDGTQYWFGYNELPGWAAGNATTNSVDTEPVYSTASGQPCYNSAFASSYCANMAYRWNLDYVVDTHQDVISYWYQTDTNYYAQDKGTVNDPPADYTDTRYTYTPGGKQASQADPAGNTWSWAYNLPGQQTDAYDPDTGHAASTYDNAGQLLTSTDARGKQVTYTYDADGRTTAVPRH